MPQAEAVELRDVQKTLFLPLWGRAVEAEKKHPLLVDREAAQIVAAVGYDFSTIARNISPVTRLSWVARSLHTDRTIRNMLARDPRATIVNLGCGLDTTFERTDNGSLEWYDLDLPDVIELRKRFIAENTRRHTVACSLLDDAWLRQVKITANVLFIAAGVLYYFEESQVKALLTRMADAFPGAELLFDACTPGGVRLANKKVIAGGGMDESAILKWGIERVRDMESWDSRIGVLAAEPIFRHMMHGIALRERLGTMLSDALGIMTMVHLRLGRPSTSCSSAAL